MKDRFNKILLLFLCLIMICSMGLVSVVYSVDEQRDVIDSGDCGLYGDNLKWIFYSDGELVISGDGEMNWYYVDHNDGGKETSRSAPWSKYYNDIAVITIEEGVTSIGNDALIEKNIQYHKVNLPRSLEYFECLIDFNGNIYETVKTYQTKGKHIAFCYAGTQAEWDKVVCRHYRMAVDEKTKEYDIRYRKSSTENRIRHTGYQDYMDMYFNGEEPVDFCKIQRTNATVTTMRLEKVELYPYYYVGNDNGAELVWTIDGKSIFVYGDSDKTTKGNEVEMIFLDDTTVKLQLISSKGDVICEDEIFLKASNSTPFLANLQAWILLAVMIFVGVVGGTIGPWIGSLL